MVKNKINDVEEEVCKFCAQNWQDECRAYSFPLTQKEREQRLSGGTCCIGWDVPKVYRGERLGEPWGLPPVKVTVNGEPLEHIVQHSPTGMEWGYPGSGPSDLALSILTDYLQSDKVARSEYFAFRDKFVARWGPKWEIKGKEIADWLLERWKGEEVME